MRSSSTREPELVVAWKIKKGRVKRKEKGQEAYGMDGWLFDLKRQQECARAGLRRMREKGGEGGRGSSLLTKRKAAKQAQWHRPAMAMEGGKGWEEVNDGEE